MQFLLLIYDDETCWTNPSDDPQDDDYPEDSTFGRQFAKVIRGANALQPSPTAKTVRVRDGKTEVTHGPFAETRQQLGGYYLVEADNTGEAVAMAARVPWARFGSVEVRPIVTFS
jgi:hypothetical protein